jgi:hypothetical protein
MATKSYYTLLLLAAILLATIRPVLASHGWLGLPAVPRGATSETEEREGGESERSTEAENAWEGRKVRRGVSLLNSHHASVSLLVDRRTVGHHLLSGSHDFLPVTTSEHCLRFGLGTPIRI